MTSGGARGSPLRSEASMSVVSEGDDHCHWLEAVALATRITGIHGHVSAIRALIPVCPPGQDPESPTLDLPCNSELHLATKQYQRLHRQR